MLQKAQHFTDIPITGRKYRRVISNWLNFQEQGQDWKESAPNVELALGVPTGWQGNFDFKYQSLRGSLQCFCGDSTDPINTALVGVRKASDYNSWINYKALDVNESVDMEIFSIQKAVRWRNLWHNTNLSYQMGRHKLDKQIKLKAPGHPESFRFAFRIPVGMSYEFVNNQLLLRDELGTVVLYGLSPWGKDSSVITLEGGQRIRVAMIESDPVTFHGKTFPTLTLTPNSEDLAGAIYPVTVDPTTQITGTTDIEDGFLWRYTNPDNNYGGDGYLYAGYHYQRHPIVRIATASAIPSGTITGFRLYLYNNRTPAIELEAYFIQDANDWVEGNSWGAPEDGACSWNHAKRTGQAWAGSVGCETSGTDYDADASPPTLILQGAGWHTFTLKPAWPPLWRDGVRALNGISIKPTDTVGWDYTYVWPSEHGTNPLYFEIDYDEGGSSIPVFMNHYQQMRKQCS